MPGSRSLLIASAVLAFALDSSGHAPAPMLPNLAAGHIPTGKWKVTFANGVVETCSIQKDGKASVDEPKRTSDGKVTVKDGIAILVFKDDRIERWTPIGRRMIVEHWFPPTQFPNGGRVLGIAERSP
jgi:hypothetical protein